MLYLAAAGIVVTTVLSVDSVASLLFSATFILVVLLWCAGALRSVIWTDAVLILMVGLALSHVILNAWFQGTPVSFAYFKKYFMFICTLVYFQAAYKLRIDEKTEKFLLTVNSALALFFAAYYLSHRIEVYMLNGIVTNYLTFGFTNPNLTALFLMCAYTGQLVQIARNRQFFPRLLHLILAAAVCWFIWETKSRNCMITVSLVTGMCVLLYLTKHGFRLPGWFSLLISVWPIMFAVAYVVLVRNPQIQSIFSFLVSSGKNLDARLSVWLPALQYYAGSPILGAYSQISKGSGMSQMHNTHLDILVSYGTVILILTCYLLHSVIRSADGENMKEETMVRLCFCGTIIMGMGEAALFSGGLGIYLFAGMFLLLCNRDRSEAGESNRIGG
ncbi:MAG: hypothetical protein IJX04_08715 [Oscillospiraceae bacterium]|nr:hypothetical protein [Oscillospiraceae bacterium]